MPILGTLLKRGIQIRRAASLKRGSDAANQYRVLRKLLLTAAETEIGQEFGFASLAAKYYTRSPQAMYQAYKAALPIFDYNAIFARYWHKTLAGQEDVCWPGRTKYFAVSSGTSEAASKHIPVTSDMTRHIRRTGIRQILTLSDYDLPAGLFTRGVLMLGGSTRLNRVGYSYEGDLSGIQAKQIPRWFQPFYKPGRKIAGNQDWAAKLEEITLAAKDWDIGYVAGVPAWMQILFEKIIAHYGVKTIHDIWPNLAVFTTGGVAFEPYRKGFEALLAHPIIYLETYLASEGFVAYQAREGAKGMKLVADIGIFFEFIPFTEANFSVDGDLLPGAQTLALAEVEENVEYAILLSTCAGAWRYLIGDVIKFVDLPRSELVIAGRTRHYLSLTGEHLSVDNMNRAVELAQQELGIAIREFGVAGVPEGTLFAHHWYIGTDDKVDANDLATRIDGHLKALNDDYRTERAHALRSVTATILPVHTFYDFMRQRGKEGGQNKFPRVLKKGVLTEWKAFLSE